MQVVFDTWESVTDCISEINNIQVNDAKDLDVAMLDLDV